MKKKLKRTKKSVSKKNFNQKKEKPIPKLAKKKEKGMQICRKEVDTGNYDKDLSDSRNTMEVFDLLKDRLPISDYRYYARIDSNTVNRITRRADGSYMRELLFYPSNTETIKKFMKEMPGPTNWYQACLHKLITDGICIVGKFDSANPDIPFEFNIPSVKNKNKIQRHKLKKQEKQGGIKRFKLNSKKETENFCKKEKPERIKLQRKDNPDRREIPSNKNKIQSTVKRIKLQRC